MRLRIVVAVIFSACSAHASEPDEIDKAWECSYEAAIRFAESNRSEPASLIAETAYSTCENLWDRVVKVQVGVVPKSKESEVTKNLQEFTMDYFVKLLTKKIIVFKSR